MPTENELDTALHFHIVQGLLKDGFAPSELSLSKLADVEPAAVRAGLKRLEANHGIVCHPGTSTPWVVHPFSLTPTATWVQGSKRGWWAPCIWCALGVATLACEDVTIHSRIGGEAADIDIHVKNGKVSEDQLVTHFSIPLQDAWRNVHRFCATVLPFRTESDVDAWSDNHDIPKGAVVPIAQVADLARIWYGKHADRDWKKWSVAETREIFARVGLTDRFWSLEGSAGAATF
jgi:Alkylmercury lyase